MLRASPESSHTTPVNSVPILRHFMQVLVFHFHQILKRKCTLTNTVNSHQYCTLLSVLTHSHQYCTLTSIVHSHQYGTLLPVLHTLASTAHPHTLASTVQSHQYCTLLPVLYTLTSTVHSCQ